MTPDELAQARGILEKRRADLAALRLRKADVDAKLEDVAAAVLDIERAIEAAEVCGS